MVSCMLSLDFIEVNCFKLILLTEADFESSYESNELLQFSLPPFRQLLIIQQFYVTGAFQSFTALGRSASIS